MGSRLVGRPRTRWIDSMNDSFETRDLCVGASKKEDTNENGWHNFMKTGTDWGGA